MKKFGMIAALVAALGLALAFSGCSGGDGAPFSPSGGYMPGGKKAAVISFATSEVDKLTSDGAFTNELSNSGDGAVRYESSNTGAATVDAATGQVTIVAEGTATITATVADSPTYYYEQKTASYTLSGLFGGFGDSAYDRNKRPFKQRSSDRPKTLVYL